MTRLVIGKTKKGREVVLSPTVRATHMQVIGASGTGKTKFLEHMIREDIYENNGLCLIDPTGNLYGDLVAWCQNKEFIGHKQIFLFDPSSHIWSFGFNPLDFGQRPDEDLSFYVDSMVRACAKVWGGEDTDKTPLLKRCLRLTFHALAEHDLTLLEAIDLIRSGDSPIRNYLVKRLEDPVIRAQWEDFLTLRPRDFEERFGSTINRLMEFLASERIRRILGHKTGTINFRRVMDEGHIVLVNLSSGRKISEDNASLLGTLMVNDLFLKARSRPKGSRPFYLYIDECSRFISEDIGRILDEGRQFGLHLILAHQHLAQLKRAGEAVYGAVMTDARTKVVFGGLSPEDAKIMAEVLYMGEIDLEEEKSRLNKPVVVGQERIMLHSSSVTTGTTVTSGEGSSWGDSSARNQSETITYQDEWLFAEELSRASTIGSSSGTNTGRSTSRSTAEVDTETYGTSEGLASVYRDMPTTVHSLEEQLHRRAATLRNLKPQQAAVKIPNRWSVAMRSMTVEPPYIREDWLEAFKEKSFRQNPFATLASEVDRQLLERRKQLEDAMRPEEEPEAQEDFLE